MEGSEGYRTWRWPFGLMVYASLPRLLNLLNVAVNPSTALVTASLAGRASRQPRCACGDGLTHASNSDWAWKLRFFLGS
jgi:hypothetical protein